jgi:O-antigen/teichoic acid export membrane protein
MSDPVYEPQESILSPKPLVDRLVDEYISTDPAEESCSEDSHSEEVDSSTARSVAKKKVIRGSAWTMLGHGSNQVIRLGSNLILTRLLFPEAFGLMSLVQVFLTGLEMFSDVGITPSIIHNERGNDPKFLNTAWTIQVVRGVLLWLGACLIAYPASLFYREPQLLQLLPVVGLTALIAGLNSTKLATANRRIELGKLTALEISSYVLSVIVMIVGAWLYPSVWALVVGGLVNALAKMLLSHFYLQGERNHFHWDRTAFESLHKFGRWVFLSTVLAFFSIQGDRLVLGRLLDVRFLGVYNIALMLSRAVGEILSQISGKVLFPFYAEMFRESPERVYRVLRKNRILLIGLTWGFCLFFIVFGQVLVDFLYKQDYTEAGWMLQVLSIGGLVDAVFMSYGNVLMARGRTFDLAVLLGIKTFVQFSAMLIGNYFGGQQGVIIGLAAMNWVLYPAEAICYKRLSLWQPEVDLPVIGLATIVAGVFFFMVQ